MKKAKIIEREEPLVKMIPVKIKLAMDRWAVEQVNLEASTDKDASYLKYLGQAVFWANYRMAKRIGTDHHDFFFNNREIKIKDYYLSEEPDIEKLLVQVPETDLTDREGVIFFFIFIDPPNKRAWIMGWMSHSGLNKKAFKENGFYKIELLRLDKPVIMPTKDKEFLYKRYRRIKSGVSKR